MYKIMIFATNTEKLCYVCILIIQRWRILTYKQ